MSKLQIEILPESPGNSGNEEIIGMVDDGSFGSVEEKSQMFNQQFLDSNEEDSSVAYNFRELASSDTYKLVHTPTSEGNIMSEISPDTKFYLIDNSQVFSTTAQNKPQNAKPVTSMGKKRDDRRRATHNEVERRRRDKINNWITRLASMVPNSGLPDSASKGRILAKACSYIQELSDKQKKTKKLELAHENLLVELCRLRQEVSELRKENMALRSQIANNSAGAIGVHFRSKADK